MSLYRVHFKWKNKDVQLNAKSLDLTHPYFVSIKSLVFPAGKKLIINPSEDELRKTFSEATHVMIPFQTVILIEELSEDDSTKVMPFTILDEGEDSGPDLDGDS